MSTYEDDEDYNPDYNEDEEYEMMYLHIAPKGYQV